MSSSGGSSGLFGHAQNASRDKDVPPGLLQRSNGLSSLQHQKSDLALSLDPLPPPPLPDEPPIGPEFNPSDSENCENPSVDLKPVHRFIPDSWKNFFRGSNKSSNSSVPVSSTLNTTTKGIRCSPPHSPSVSESYHDKFGGSGGSYHSRIEREAMLHPESMDGRTAHTTLSYSERVEEYHQRYAYMKSWPGLLRILGCIELLLGAAVFACVCAYIHKDNEWYNMFGYSQPQMYGGYGGVYGMYGDTYYTGPKTPFILVVAGLAWIVTVIILVLGMSMYYRTILLDSNWWPLTEFAINLALAILYMAAGIVYVRDTTRAGLCYYPIFNNGINAAFCRTEAGQTAAIIFLFVGMLVYLIGAIVCLKLWRHEAARRYREKYGHEMQPELLVAHSTAGPRIPEPVLQSSAAPVQTEAPAPSKTKVLKAHIPAGYIPKPVIVPDYLSKYPVIQTDEERDQYKAVFNDQYSEYKELHAEVHATMKKFDEMDSMMRNLPRHLSSQEEVDRINRILQVYQQKKNDPSFLEKKERCEYLKNKLAHIKHRIQEYDKVMAWNDGYGSWDTSASVADFSGSYAGRGYVGNSFGGSFGEYWAQSRMFYLIIIITTAILALLIFVATIIYLVAVNPMAQSSVSAQYYQVQSLCSQYQGHQPSEPLTNQYLYHYCVVDLQEMSSRPNGSPPPYESDHDYNVVPQPAYSYYADDEIQHFYRWNSPPGIIKIMAVICIVLCVGIFACVASTLAWDTNTSVPGITGGYGVPNYGGTSFGGSSFNGGFGGAPYGVMSSQNDPRQAKAFMIAMAVITFITVLAIFIIILSHKQWVQSRKFYLIVIITTAILALLVFVATIVYLVAVNPTAQSSGSAQSYQIQSLCSQYKYNQPMQGLTNQYLYHYCVVDPQEAVAIVFGFLVIVCLIIIMVFAIKTRKKINASGKGNIMWHRVKTVDEPNAPQDVEDWVNNVSGDPALVNSDFPEKFGGSRERLDDNSTNYGDNGFLAVEHNVPLQNSAPYYSSSDMASSASKPKKKRAGRPRRTDGKDYDTDYASSGDELDDEDFSREFPPIANVHERDNYKREFDRDHQEYKNLQAEMDEINKRLAEVDRELDELEEGSPQYQNAMDEYNALKHQKRSGDYRVKKRRCKELKAKLNHIKKMVSDYDSGR
ncbi:uncharacterized protein LOC132873813 [Neoarius graeffei]|uniref:uncharacterized protein LOC132873813 n=1 Tax=Neoarius graeffei TaxID=443677 RepID=UPI00298C2B0D|nr:uncharacterized protein LOC132873813 [Neoarius graeffei]